MNDHRPMLVLQGGLAGEKKPNSVEIAQTATHLAKFLLTSEPEFTLCICSKTLCREATLQ